MKDSLGNEITAGCYLAWATREGSCHSALRIGRVLGVGMKEEYGTKTPHISVLMLTTDRGLTSKTRKTTLSIPGRSIVISPSSLPDRHYGLLCAAAIEGWATSCPVDPDYVCGADYCDDPACNTHGPRKDDA
jgi:hypothetical protein